MGKVEFLLKSKLNDIDIKGLEVLKNEYFKLLLVNKFPNAPISGDFYEMIKYLKRKDEQNPIAIGPYLNITPFEAANRIASDLIIINGLIQLVYDKKLENTIFTLRLGTTHVKDKGDFTIKIGKEEYEGEAFNVAPSFLSSKLQQTIKKWKGNNSLRYILVNKEAFTKDKKIDERVFKVDKWNEFKLHLSEAIESLPNR